MKIDLATLRPSMLEIPEQVASLLDRLKRAETLENLVDEMKNLKEWPTLHGKSELVRWAPILNRLDEILELGARQTDYRLAVDSDTNIKKMVEVALKFSAQVFENTTSRSAYSSVDRLLAMMESSDPHIIIEVLLVFQVMGKRSRFLSNRLSPDLQKRLVEKLAALTECWGGRLREVKLTECIKPSITLPQPFFPLSFTASSGQSVSIPKPDETTPLLKLVEDTLTKFDGDDADRASLVARLRLLRRFDDQTHRVDWLIARLLAMSTLLYSRCGSDELAAMVPVLPPPGFIEQTCSLLHVEDGIHDRVDMIKSEALRTLTAICSNETKPHRIDSSAIRRRLLTIMEQLGATSYHGFLATYVRSCVEDLKKGLIGKPGHPSIGLCTALFSLLYHMASLDHPRRTPGASQETLISAGITQTMLSVISYHDLPPEYTSFVTRCVRVIDVVSALDVQGFISHKGLETCVNRLCFEVEECKKEHGYVIDVEADDETKPVPATYIRAPKQTTFCHHQRGALIKSLLNFLKRIINERDFVEQVRHLMEYGLPDALRHIFSNIEYYSSALFHYSMQLVQNFVYQEPAQLTLLQNHHVPYTLLMAVLRKDVEPTRDIITTMSQVFSAFCLNERGMTQFLKFKAFDEMIRIVLTAKYINTMKRRRGGDLMDDCSYNMGTTLDDLLRQKADLREQCLDSFIETLKRLIKLGTESPPAGVKIVMTLQKHPRGSLISNYGADFVTPDTVMSRGDSVGVNSPRDMEGASDEDEIDPASVESGESMDASPSSPAVSDSITMSVEEKRSRDTMEMTTLDSTGQRVLPLGDYMCILVRIIEVVMAASPVADMTDGLVARDGVSLLLQSMSLPNLQMELAASAYPSVVATIVRQAVGGQPNMVQRHPAPNASPVREEVMKAMVKWATDSLAPIAELARREEGREGISLLHKMSTDDAEADYSRLCGMAASVLNVTAMLVGVTKCAAVLSSHRDNDLRSKVITMWTEEGAELHSMLHRIYSVFAWEQSISVSLRAAQKRAKMAALEKEGALPRSRSSSSFSVDAGVALATDADSIRATVGDPTSDTSIESEDVEMMQLPSTSGTIDDGAKSDRELKAAAAESIGLTREEGEFYQGFVRRPDYLKQMNKAVRSVQELLGYFSRVCIGNTTRARRGGAYDAALPYNLTKNAQKLVSVIFREYRTDLEFAPIAAKASSAVTAFYLSDLLVTLHPLLMDEKKSQYHHLVARFYSSGCYKAVFGILTEFLAPALAEKKLHFGYEMLFQEWCRLISGLSQRTGLVASRYKMVEAQAKQFPIDKYYTLMQTDIFNALHTLVPALRQQSSGGFASKPNLTEQLFCLLCDVTKNLTELREEEIEQIGDGTSLADRPLSDADAIAVQRLMDMGFERAACVQALAETTSVSEAMDMLLNERALAVGGEGGAAAAGNLMMMNQLQAIVGDEGDDGPWMEVMHNLVGIGGRGEEDPEALIAQAVLRRRGLLADVPEGAAALANEVAAAAAAAADAVAVEAGAAAPAAEDVAGPSTPPAEDLAAKEVKLDWDTVVACTTSEWIPLMLEMSMKKRKMPHDNKIVYHMADLTNAIWRFASEEWKREELLKKTLREEIASRIGKVRALDVKPELLAEIGTHLHYACLIFESMAADYVKVLSSDGSIVTPLLDLIDYATTHMDLDEFTVATVINPALLWLEMYDKFTHYVRRLEVYAKCEQPLAFSYYSYEDRYNAARGKWQNYSTALCKKMAKAFLAGEQTVSVKNRRDFIVDLVDLIQTQEGSSERVNVMVMMAESDAEKIDVDEFLAMEKRPIYSEVEMAKMVNVLVSLLSKCHIASYGAHSALELLVRLTRDETVAAHFVQNRGLEAIMKVRGASVRYSEALFTQLVRQCVEDESLMTKVFDQMIRQSCMVGIKPVVSGRWQSSPFTKDALQILAYVAHSATRSPLHYYNALMKYVKLDKNGLMVGEQPVAAAGTAKSTEPTLKITTTTAAAAAAAAKPDEVPSTPVSKTAPAGVSATPGGVGEETEKEKKYTGPGLAIVEMLLNEANVGDWSTTTTADQTIKKPPGVIFRLFSKSTLLYTLAELVRSYPFVATTLTELKDKDSGNSVMFMLMDKFSDPTIEKDTSNALHVLLATLSTTTNPKAHDNVLTDMKNCLIGFATAPENHTNVHLKINELALVLSSMMTSCPNNPPIRKEGAVGHPGAGQNSIIKLAVKKRILNELIRCVTRLVLSKRESIETVNTVIRAIDEMTKACNMTNPLAAIPQLAQSRDSRLIATMNELFQNYTMDAGNGAPQATLRRVDVGPNGDMTEAVVQIDMNNMDAAGLESVMERVNAAVNMATREVERRQRDGEGGGAVVQMQVSHVLGNPLIDEPAAAAADRGAEQADGEMDEMRSESSSSHHDDDGPLRDAEMMEHEEEEGRGGGGGGMMEEDDDGDDEEEEDMEDEQYEDGYDDEHHDGDVLEEGDEDEEDEDDDDDEGEDEEDEEEAAREDERERAQHALASASAGGEEGEGERTGEDEGESEVEGDDDDPFGAFEHISYLERDAAAGAARPSAQLGALQRIFMDIDSVRGAGGAVGGPPPELFGLAGGAGERWAREFSWDRGLQDLLYGGGAGGPALGYDAFGAPRHIARWDQSPERTARATGGVHPLMQRPGSGFEGSPELHQQISLTRQRMAERAGGMGAMAIRTGGALDTLASTHRQRLHLIRQNAVRRNRDTVARTDPDFRRLLEATAARDHGPLGLHASWRPIETNNFDDMFAHPFGGLGGAGAAGGGMAAEDHHARMTSRLLTESCPSTMDRFRESGRVLDDVHGHIMAAIVNSIVYYKFKKEEADARAKEAEVKRLAEESAKARKEEAEREKKEKEDRERDERVARGETVTIPLVPSSSDLNTAREVEEEQMEADGDEEEEVEMEVTPTAAAVEEAANEPPAEDEDNNMDTTSPPATQAAAGDTTGAAAAAVGGSDESGEHSNGGSSTGATMGDETSPSGEATTTQPPQEPPVEQTAAPAAAAQPEMQEVPEQYREILGVDTLPAGIDADFLAALPEDMRAEVLRDHERQQRQAAVAAARAAAVPPPAAPAAPADATAAAADPAAGSAPAAPAAAPVATGAAASAPGIDPLDPDFLSALPPELAAEVIEQHERSVRLAIAAASAAAAPPVPPPVDEAAEAAEVIRSLPPTLRSQVLADADDSVLAALPPEMADEARRLRNERGAHVARVSDLIAQMADGHGYPHRPRGMMVRAAPGGTARMQAGRAAAAAQAQSGVGQLAGSTMTASTKGIQMLDRDALSALIVMFFADARLSQPRLQKTLRDLCTHKGTCDYLIYALLAILKQISENKHQEEEEETPSDSKSWTDSITVSGVGHNERVVKIDKEGGVSIHPLHAATVAKNVVDLLVTIARQYPGHFVPHVLRKENAGATGAAKPDPAAVPMPPFEHFWQTVYAYTTSKPGASAKEGLPEHRVDSLEESPLACCMQLLQTNTMKTTAGLNEKLLRLVYTIVQTLPDDTLARLKKDAGSVMSEETPLSDQLKLVTSLLTSGHLSPDALHDGRMLLVEAMRAMNFRTTTTIYDMLVKRIELLGTQLEPQISALLDDLGAVPEGSGPSTSKQSKYDQDLSREQRRRTEMERENMFHALHSIRNDQRPVGGVMSSCPELQVPSVRALQEKGGVQSALLGALQTICKTRDTLGLLMGDRKRARTDIAQKKLDKAKKEYDERKKKAEQEAAVAAAAAAALAVAAETPAAPDATPAASSDAPAETAAAVVPPSSTSDAATTASVETTDTAAQTVAPAAGAAAAVPAPFSFDEQPPKLEDFLEPETAEPIPDLKLSAQLKSLEGLWSVLSDCLQRLGRASDPHAILVLQPAAEAFFLVHAVTAEKAREAAATREQAAAAAPGPVATSTSTDAAAVAAGDEDTTKLLQFAEKHRSVLNQVLRQNQASLQDGPFAILAACPKLLDFDVKRTHFRKQLGRMDDRQRYRRDDVPLRIRRAHIFSDSFRELFRLRGNEWKSRFYIMFEGEEGQDAGGLLREWFSVITREIFNPNYALFITAPGDRSTYMINKASYINPEHLDYFKFVGRIIAKAIHDNKLLDCYFTRAFYKHILNLPVKYQDLESEDPEFYKSFDYLLNNPVETMGIDLTFTLEVEEFGVVSTRDLKEGGAELIVTDENKEEYVRLVCQMKMTSSIRRQLDAFLDGFYEVIPKQLIAMFNEQELELLISGLPDVDIDDLAANTEYRSYTKNSREIQWFWRALRSFEPEDRAKFLQFVTGTSKVPLNGFGSLEGMNGAQKFSIHQDSRTGNRLPAAHTCFNQLDLPVYDSYEKLREALLLAIRECTEGFGFA
ncbi:hypothetical protein PENTCL1PPCAC_16280 [Pristionchus entomophagus]|uniref:HECT-type E3 ubiquitin transferase n=1 Tax=Pristionchus entomophagus TaxID=358040 RepID=A0AAV5TIB3_9BILA|nr:hypothetical protein PENTCL1PPCAC_16280 [Pristionchus entomophagus]